MGGGVWWWGDVGGTQPPHIYKSGTIKQEKSSVLNVTSTRWMSDARVGAGNLAQDMCSLRLWKSPLDNTDGKAGGREKGKESRQGRGRKRTSREGIRHLALQLFLGPLESL